MGETFNTSISTRYLWYIIGHVLQYRNNNNLRIQRCSITSFLQAEMVAYQSSPVVKSLQAAILDKADVISRDKRQYWCIFQVCKKINALKNAACTS